MSNLDKIQDDKGGQGKSSLSKAKEYFSSWFVEMLRWRDWVSEEDRITNLTSVAWKHFPGSMVTALIYTMDDSSLEKFRKMAPGVEIEKWDDVMKLYVGTRYDAILEAKWSNIPVDENLSNIEWILNDFINLQKYYRDRPSEKLPKYVIGVSYLASKLKLVWFDIIDLWENVNLTEHADMFAIHPLTKKTLRTTNKIRWSILSVLKGTPLLNKMLASKIENMEYEYETNRLRHRTMDRYKKEDIKLAIIPIEKFLHIDFKRTLKERKVVYLQDDDLTTE